MSGFSAYELRSTGLVACMFDQRFSYALHIPESYDPNAGSHQSFDLIIPVHGSNRPAMYYRDSFVDLAETHKCFVLAPLFPIGIVNRGSVDNYKYIDYLGIRYDLVLINMIREVSERYKVKFPRRLIHGFSGGGQFVHRFYYLHPDKLDAVSIGAPGKVTLLDENNPWWVGTSDTVERFGIRIDIDALRRPRIMLVVGDRDVDDREIHVPEGSDLWMPGANDAGRTRIERLESLHRNLATHGIDSRITLIENVEHSDRGPMMSEVVRFFRGFLEEAA